MQTLKQYIQDADSKHSVVGHFNMSNIEGMWAIFRVAKKMGVPIILGTSEKERAFMGVKQCVALVKSLREEFNHPVFLNADHTYSFEKVKEAVDAGYDAVIFDGVKLPLDENIEATKRCVDYAKSKNPDIIVEGELGYIGTSSKMYEIMPSDISVSAENLTKPEDAERFVKETGVDLFAPAVGNIHGMLKNSPDPALDIDRIKTIREKAGVPLVLHGGSGTANHDFQRAILAGISVIHISTELRRAFRMELERTLHNEPDELAPYQIMENSVFEMEKVVEERLKVFGIKG
ncbi:MAG: class II fructose-bisphosphate aldolase [Parcubacteria group bacterium]|nr:class II fructose-bisphosphate aldolase [Parcubacteria group bacterium]